MYTAEKSQFPPDFGSKLCIHIPRSRYFQVPEWAAEMPVEWQQQIQEGRQKERDVIMDAFEEEKAKREVALLTEMDEEATQAESTDAPLEPDDLTIGMDLEDLDLDALQVTGVSSAGANVVDVDVLAEAYAVDIAVLMAARQVKREDDIAVLEQNQPERQAALVLALTAAGASEGAAKEIASEQLAAEHGGVRERVQLDQRIDDEGARLMALAKAQFDAAMVAVASKEEAQALKDEQDRLAGSYEADLLKCKTELGEKRGVEREALLARLEAKKAALMLKEKETLEAEGAAEAAAALALAAALEQEQTNLKREAIREKLKMNRELADASADLHAAAEKKFADAMEAAQAKEEQADIKAESDRLHAAHDEELEALRSEMDAKKQGQKQALATRLANKKAESALRKAALLAEQSAVAAVAAAASAALLDSEDAAEEGEAVGSETAEAEATPEDTALAAKKARQAKRRKQLAAKKSARQKQLNQEMYELERSFEQLAASSTEATLAEEGEPAAGTQPDLLLAACGMRVAACCLRVAACYMLIATFRVTSPHLLQILT